MKLIFQHIFVRESFKIGQYLYTPFDKNNAKILVEIMFLSHTYGIKLYIFCTVKIYDYILLFILFKMIHLYFAKGIFSTLMSFHT